MRKLNLAYPAVSKQQKQALLVAKEELENEDCGRKDKATAKAKVKAAANQKSPASSSEVSGGRSRTKSRKDRQEHA